MIESKQIRIYRFGNYINSVAKEDILQWLRDNVPYYKGDCRLSEGIPDKEVERVAHKEHYTFYSE